jgi:hypothetical protein
MICHYAMRRTCGVIDRSVTISSDEQIRDSMFIRAQHHIQPLPKDSTVLNSVSKQLNKSQFLLNGWMGIGCSDSGSMHRTSHLTYTLGRDARVLLRNKWQLRQFHVSRAIANREASPIRHLGPQAHSTNRLCSAFPGQFLRLRLSVPLM